MRRWLTIALVLAACALFFLRFVQRGSAPTDDNSTPEAEHGTVVINPLGVAREGVEPETSSTEAREPAPRAEGIASLSGVVRSSSGDPIPGARVSWQGVLLEDLELEGAWQADDWGVLSRPEGSDDTDAQGRFVLECTDAADARGIVLWATCPGFLAASLFLPPERASWPREPTLVLEPTVSIHVEVRDEEGRSVAGATVEQFGLAPPGYARANGGLSEGRLHRLLRRTAITDESGAVELGAYPGEQVLLASTPVRLSAPWRGQARERVTLTIVPVFQVSGEVALPDWNDLNYVGERRITIAAQTRNLWRPLHTIRSVQEGAWGPVTLPLLEVDRYRIRLEGSPIIPVEVGFPPPEKGAELEFDLEAEIGVDLWARVVDTSGALIRHAVVQARWQDPADPSRWNFVERSANESGQVNLWSVPPGAVNFEATAKGFVPWRSALEATFAYEDGYIPIVMETAGRLSGRCLHEGVPVRDFEVIVWRTAERERYSSTAFMDREDGSFELDTVPVGEFWITACSGGLPGSEPRQVRVDPGQIATIDLELPEGLQGSGRIVDGASGEPLPDASVQLFIKGDLAPIVRWGSPFSVRSDGTFEQSGFVVGLNHLRALAPGHSNVVLSRTVAAGEVLDWGSIALPRAQDLTIALQAPAATVAFDSIQISASGAQVLPPRFASSRGEVTYPQVSAGGYSLHFEERDATLTTIVAELEPGREWTLRPRIRGENHLTVEIVAENARLGEIGLVEAQYSSPQGQVSRSKNVVTGPLVELEGIESNAVQVNVYGRTSNLLASTSGVFVAGSLHLTIALGGDEFDLLVVDSEGTPVADARVTVCDPQHPEFAVYGSTGGNGECRLIGVPGRDVLFHLQHGTKGSRFGIPVDARSGSAELVLDEEAELELAFVDGDLPVPGVACVLADPLGRSLSLENRADDRGRAIFGRLAPERYRVRAWRAGCWPAAFEAEAREGGGETRLQIRRLGNLRLELVAGGLPVSGLDVGLESIEFGTDVEEWIAAGQVDSGGLESDGTGTITVRGLPNGAYRWTIAQATGDPLVGEVTVEAERDNVEQLTLP